MKRDQMIILLEEAISNSDNIKYLRSNCNSWGLAREILDLIEAKGMMPPFSGKIQQQDIIDRWSVGTGKTEMVRVLVNEWEPE